jgi:sterol desaturase/sphingolipid hydroxylase (fatty acid hydroxylase superfamily)
VLSFNAVYAAVAIAVWFWATPSRSTMSSLDVGWIAFVFARNAVLLVAWCGAFHVWLYVRRSQDGRFKYNPRFPAANARFLFGSQTRENVFWSLASGLPIWTAWEVVTLWLFASGRIPWIGWADHPVWFVVWMVLIPLWREVHFYTTHRSIHWPPLYKAVHSLHHRNTNPGPWSGLSMHPVEHLVYFSAVAIHWIVPSHPLHAIYNSIHLMMAPVPGHSGFDRIEVGSTSFATHCQAHYLHHKLFEVNYSDGALPLDQWFGSFHDGSPEADAAMKARRRMARVSVTSAVDA